MRRKKKYASKSIVCEVSYKEHTRLLGVRKDIRQYLIIIICLFGFDNVCFLR